MHIKAKNSIRKGGIFISLYTIGDLHLSLSVDKPMDVFGGNWENYMQKIQENWNNTVCCDDTVVIVGDVSWGMNFDQAKADFDFVNRLNGNKIVIKGNHDYWWTTMNKMNNFLQENEFTTIKILNNNYFPYGDVGICGTRGWVNDGTCDADKKVLLREKQRLTTSIESCLSEGRKPIVFLHYPPVYGTEEAEDIFSVLEKYQIEECYYGHLHGIGARKAVEGEYKNLKLKLVSCDCIQFVPIKVR